jgi:allophanate hydrolase subunit 1
MPSDRYQRVRCDARSLHIAEQMTSLISKRHPVTNGWENFGLTPLRTFLLLLTAETVPAVQGFQTFALWKPWQRSMVFSSLIDWRT